MDSHVSITTSRLGTDRSPGSGDSELTRESAGLAEQFKTALLALDQLGAEKLLLDAGLADRPAEVIERVMVPVLVSIGAGWEAGTVALSQVYMSSRICQNIVASTPGANECRRHNQPRIAVAVLDDVHTLGKSIVLSELRASGYSVEDFGACRSVAELVAMAQSHDTEVLMVSVLMLRAALRVADLRVGLDAAGLETSLVVGGAPFRFDRNLWREVGADHVGRSAADALPILEGFESGR